MIYVLLAGWLLVHCVVKLYRSRKLRHIPTLGYSWPILSYITALKFINHGYELIEDGYRKYPNQVWKIRNLDDDEGNGWYIIANGTQRVEDMSKAPTHQLNPSVFFQSFLQLDHILGRQVVENTYHINVIRTPLTRNIAGQYREFHEEIQETFDSLVHSAAGTGEWTPIPLYDSFLKVASGVMAGITIGYSHPLKSEFTKLFGSSSRRMLKGRMLHIFPKVLRPLVSRLFINAHVDIQQMSNLIEPLLIQRREEESMHDEEHSEWARKHNNMLTWMVDEARKTGAGESPYEIAVRLYFQALSLDGIARMISFALSELASRPASEYLDDIRDEVQNVLVMERSNAEFGRVNGNFDRDEGWSKQAISKMHKLDSFTKEIGRLYDVQALHMGSRVLKDFYFSDGTFVPAGSTIFANSRGSHNDYVNFPNSREFNGYRYISAINTDPGLKNDVGSEGETVSKTKQDLMTMPSPSYHTFGYGKHSCPGRFFAAHLIKTMLAHIIMNYDFELVSPTAKVDVGKPRYFPDQNADIKFRKRKV